MQCWRCLEDTSFAYVGINVTCYRCIGEENEYGTNFDGACMACGTTIGGHFFNQSANFGYLIKGSQGICFDCYQLEKEGRLNMLATHGSIPENSADGAGIIPPIPFKFK